MSDTKSKEIMIPKEVAEPYMEYCKRTKIKYPEPLRVFILESIPNLHSIENLDEIIRRTKNWKELGSECIRFSVRIPTDAIAEIKTFCKFIRVKRCHFLYYLIEKKVLSTLEDFKNGDEE